MGTGPMQGVLPSYAHGAFSNAQATAQNDLYRSMQNATQSSFGQFGNAYAYNGEVYPKPERQSPSVASTAASRVQKAEWEIRADEKEREIEEILERQRQERERVRLAEEFDGGPEPRTED